MTEIFKTVLNMSITGAYIAAAIMLLRLPMKKLPKKYSYALWGILGIRLLCPFSLSSAVSLFNIIRPETEGNRMTYVPENIEYAPAPQVTVSVPVVNEAINNTLPAAEPNNSINPMQAVIGICAAVWIAGAVIMLIYTVFSYLRVRKNVSGSRLLSDNIYICENIESPFVYGIIKPRIYVPEGVSESDMQYICAHEKTHIKRGDHIIKLTAMLALCLHWFNPLMWISYRLMVKDMELSCDEKAVRSFKEDVRKDYASALLNMSVKQNKLYGMLAFGESNIKTRIKGVLSLKKPRVIATVTAAAVLIIAAVCLLTDAERNTPFEEFGVYFSEKCIYMTPVSSLLGDDTGEIYDISDNAFMITKRGQNDFKQSFELSEWSDFPYSAEEWDGLFMAGLNSVDISGYKKKLYMKLSSSYSLMKMDSELWLVRSYKDGIWSIYSLAPYDENLSANQINSYSLGSFEITKTEEGYEVRSPETDIYFYFDENSPEYENLNVRRDYPDGNGTEVRIIPYEGGFNPYYTDICLADISGDGTDDIIVTTFITGTGVVDNVAAVIDGKDMTEIEIDRLAAEKMISEGSVSLLAEEDFDSLDPHLSATIMTELDEKYIYPYYPDKSVRRFGGMSYSYNSETGNFTGSSFFAFIKDEEYFSGIYSADLVFKYEKGRLVPESVSYNLPEKQSGEYSAVVTGITEDGSYTVKLYEAGWDIKEDDIYYVSCSEELRAGDTVKGTYADTGNYLGDCTRTIITSPSDAVKYYLFAYDRMTGNEDISSVTLSEEDIRIGQFSQSVVWQYKYPPLSDRFGLSESSQLTQVIADYIVSDRSGVHRESSVLVTESGEKGFRVIDMFPYDPQVTVCTITKVTETADSGMKQYYNAKPVNGGSEVRIYSFPPYGPFKEGDTVSVSHNGSLESGEKADNRVFSVVSADTGNIPGIEICKNYLDEYWNDFLKTGTFLPEKYISDKDMLRLANARKQRNADTVGNGVRSAEAVIDSSSVQSGTTSDKRLWIYFLYDMEMTLDDGTVTSEHFKGYSAYFELTQKADGYEIYREYQPWSDEPELLGMNGEITLPVENADIDKVIEKLTELNRSYSYKEIQYISPVYHYVREGGYSISPDDASQVRVSLHIPSHWETSGSLFAEIDGSKVFETGVPYPESEGINFDDFKTDMVMGREITVHEEKYGTAEDDYDYFISTSMPEFYSEDGSYDSYIYVISRNGYRISLHFVSDSGISMQEINSVVRSADITPFTEEISYESVTTTADYNADTKELTVTLHNGSDKAVSVWFYTAMLEHLEGDEYMLANALKNSGGAISRTEIQPGEEYVHVEDLDGLYNMKTGKWRTYVNMYYTGYGNNASERRYVYFEVE